MGEFIDYYKILGVSRNASEDEIKNAWRTLAKKYHPDRNPGDEEATRITQKLNEAYEHLGNESKNNKRQEYNRQYDEYYAAQARKQQERQQQREQEARERQERARAWQNSQSNSGYEKQNTDRQSTGSKKQSRTTAEQATEEPEERKFWNDVKQAWKEVRAEEKKEPFFARHSHLDQAIKREDKKARTKNFYYHDEEGVKRTGRKTRPRTTPEGIVFHLKRGTLHIAYETLTQLEKLTHITEDTVPKFIIRNRNVLAGALAVCIIAGGFGMKGEEPVQPAQPSYSTTTQQPTEDMDLGMDVIAGEEERKEEARVNQEYKVYRTYTIKYGDTLSQLAEDANCSLSELTAYNGIANASAIKAGQDIVIPYNIESGDLRYATYAAYLPEGMTIETFAERYSTTVSSIIALNEEAFNEEGQALSDTLLVPNFATPSEIKEQKAASQEKTYTYTKNQ